MDAPGTHCIPVREMYTLNNTSTVMFIKYIAIDLGQDYSHLEII